MNLVSGHAFLYTDYAFIRKASLISLLSPSTNIFVEGFKSGVRENPPYTSLVFDLDKGNKTVSGHLEIGGPSFVSNFFWGMKIGVFSKIRANISSAKISENFGVYELSESFNRQVINFEKSQVAGMMWREIGLHVSKSFKQFDVGVNLKRLDAYEGFFAKVDNAQDVSYAGGIVSFDTNTLGGGLGYTRNGIYAGNFDITNTQNHGSGYAIDLGISFNVEEVAVGVSLLDLGFIDFKHHVENYALPDNYTDFDVNPDDYLEVNSLDDLINQLEVDTPFEPFFNHRGFVIGTPAAINLTADWRYEKNYFISASWTQRLRLTNISTVSDNALSIIPRYQTKWISGYLPITLYNYTKPRIGIAGRLGYLTLGSDDILSVFRQSDFRGSDIYFKLSLTPLIVNKRRQNRKKRSGSNAKCYEF